MKKFLIIIFSAISIFAPYQKADSTLSDPSVRIVCSDSRAIVLEFSSPKFKVKKKKVKDERFQLVEIEGFGRISEPGKPQLPVKGALIGIPNQGEVEVRVLESECSLYQGYNIYPSPEISLDTEANFRRIKKRFFKDQSIYSKNSFYPASAIELGFSGMMRDQKVSQIKFYPIQYNPITKELKFYKRIRVRVVLVKSNPPLPPFSKGGLGGLRATKVAPTHLHTHSDRAGAYEELMKDVIINYDALDRAKGTKPSSAGMSLRGVKPDCRQAGDQSNLVNNAAVENNKIKISIDEDGIYKITFSDLKNAGMDLSGINPEFIKMFNKGKEIAIDVYDDGNGYFNDGDYILFYGKAMTGIFTKENIYWFYAGEDAGLRMAEKDGSPLNSEINSNYYKATSHYEEDNEFWRSLPGGEDKDHWFWKEINILPSMSLANLSFELNNIADIAENISMRVSLQGKSDDLAVSPNHHTKIYLNDSLIDDFLWSGQTEIMRNISIPQSLLINGENKLDIEEVNDKGALVDIIYLNWFELDYLDKYIAEDNLLEFSQEETGAYNLKIDGFTNGDIYIFDISDPDNVLKITNNVTESSESGFATKFKIDGKKKFIALSSDKIKKPIALVLDEPSSLKSSDNGADYIIITHEDFYKNILPLAEYRKNKGLRVKVVKVTDIYDEFSYGIFDPGAIKDFLKYAYENWEQPAPTYVLLVGGANEDYKGSSKSILKNYIPTHLYKSSEMGFTYSDNWFVSVTTDDNGNYDILPDMFIGRITKTGSDIDTIVKKIMDYEDNKVVEGWQKRALFVADDDDPAFERVSNELADLYFPKTSTKIYLSTYSDSEKENNKMREDIIKNINDGVLITNYIGHGNKDKWAKEYMFQSADIPLLDNKEKLTFVTNFNCQTGLFAYYKGSYSIAEEFLRAEDKGAVAVFAPAGLGYTSEHAILAKYLFSNLFSDSHKDLGVSTTEAKISAYADGVSPSIVETYILFGDPALRLRQNENLRIISEALPDGKVRTRYSFAFEANGGFPPYRWQMKGRFPPGLKLNKNTGKIYGKPTKPGVYNFRIIVSDSGNKSKVYKKFSIVIKPRNIKKK